MTQSGGMGGIGQLIGGWLPGGQAPGTVVGQETPEWDFPMGADRLPNDVIGNFFRSDAGPTGLNEFLQQAMQSDPGIIDRFRSYVNMGLIRPKNAAAQNIVTGYGGYRAGDMTPLGPLINGMPSGLTESQLGTLSNLLQTGANYQIQMLERMGYFEGMPTLERQKVEQELAQGWMGKAIEQFQAMETQRGNMAQEGLEQQTITNQNIQKMAELFGGQMVTDPATGQQRFQPTEEGRQFNTEQSGYLDGQATLTREQQAFNQAKDVAALASNPRNYIEAQMLGNARGGLGGLAPNNQVQQTTFGPATTTTQMPQFNAPGGPFNQMPTLSTMTGAPGPGSQAGAQMAMPNAQQAGAMQTAPPPDGFSGGQGMDFNNPDLWRTYTNQANQQAQAALSGMGGLGSLPGIQGMMPTQQTPPGPGPGQPPWPGLPSGAGAPEPMMYAGGGPDASGRWFNERTGQYETGPMPTAQENYQRRMEMFRQQGQQAPGVGAQPLTPGQPGEQMNDIWMGMPRQPQQPRQMPGADGLNTAWMGMPQAQQAWQKASPMAAFNRGQDVAGANQGAKIPVSAFTNALMQNRVTPGSGAIQGRGAMMTAQQIQGGFNPRKLRTQDYLKGNSSERAMTNAVGSMAGYSDEDLSDQLKKNLPTFQAPGAGRMV